MRKEFQFQYGTIKRQQDVADKAGVVVFQFQYGTIKSLPTMLERFQVLRRFNSNMVQLRDNQRFIVKDATDVSIPIWYN